MNDCQWQSHNKPRGSRRLTEGVSLFGCNTGKTLPQSNIGSEEPMFDSPLTEGAKVTVLS